MIIRIIIEIVLGIILLCAGSAFWNCVKSPKFLAKILGDYDQLKQFYYHLGKEEIKRESEKVDPKIGYSANIALWINVSVSTLDKTRNMLLLVIGGTLIGSYFLGNIFLFINIVLLILMAFPGISRAAQNNIFSDIHTIMVNVHRWNKVDHNECERFCNLEQPRIFKKIFTEL